MNIKLIILGNPIPKARPRFAKKGRRTKPYDPQKDKKLMVSAILKRDYGSVLIDQPVSVDFVFAMPIPKSTSKKKADHMVEGLIKHDKTPDIDNCIKFYLDCMNNVVLVDDRLVYKISAEKIYATIPYTEIQVSLLS